MKNLYNITKWQLITVWIFSVFGWVYAADASDLGSGFGDFMIVFIPFALIFYTIGWRNNKKS